MCFRGKKKAPTQTIVEDIMESALESPVNHIVKTYFFKKILKQLKIYSRLQREQRDPMSLHPDSPNECILPNYSTKLKPGNTFV